MRRDNRVPFWCHRNTDGELRLDGSIHRIDADLDFVAARPSLANAFTSQIIDRVFAPNRIKHKIFLQSLYVLSRPLAGAFDEKTGLQAWT